MKPHFLRLTEVAGSEAPSRLPKIANAEIAAQPALPVPLSDEQVIEQVRDGQTAQFEILMRRHNQRLYRLLRSMGVSNHEAEEAMQDTYVRAYQNLSQFQGSSRFSTWLMRIAMNAARDRFRSRRPTTAFHDQGMPAASDDQPARSAELCELRCILSAAVERLPKHLRMVFVLREVEGLSGVEVAKCLGISESNEKVRLHRAKEQLQEWINERVGGEARRLYEFNADRCNRVVAGVVTRLAEQIIR